MSQSCHRFHNINSISLSYLKDTLGPWKTCPRKECPGNMLEVYISYGNKDKVYKEWECSCCGKTLKNQKDAQERYEKNKKNRNKRGYKKDYSTINRNRDL